jgi:hypothetical protein
MRYYAVEGRPAEPALGSMPKNPVPTNPILTLSPPLIRWFVDVDEMPVTETIAFNLGNEGWRPMPYTLSVAGENGVDLSIPNPTGLVGPLYPVSIQAMVAISRPLGIYTAVLRIESSPETTNAPATVPIEVHVVPQVYKIMLPAIFG